MPRQPFRSDDRSLIKTPIAGTRSYMFELYPFPYYAQEKYYTCGPAVTRMALDWFGCPVYSENTTAALVGTIHPDPNGPNSPAGTYLPDMLSYIALAGWSWYYLRVSTDIMTMKNDLFYAIDSLWMPPIIGVKSKPSIGWQYDTGPHFIISYGVENDASQFVFADPWGGFCGDPNLERYSNTAYNLYLAFSNHTAGYSY